MKISEKSKFLVQSKRIGEIFEDLNKLIRANNSNWMENNQQAKKKENVIWKLFANMHFNL